MQSLTAAHLVLEPLTIAHTEAMFEVLADPEIYRHLDHPPPPSIEHLRDVYAQLEARKSPDGNELWLNWVVRPPGQLPLGYVQATVFAPGSAWVAYALSSRHWGRGHAHAAMSAMLEHLRTAYGVVRFLATVETANRRSIALLTRLAFRLATPQEAGRHELSETERLYLRWCPQCAQ